MVDGLGKHVKYERMNELHNNSIYGIQIRITCRSRLILNGEPFVQS